MPQVFISYSRKDSAFIDQLVADLQSAGLTVWYDLSGLDGGTQWETEIQVAIEQSQFFLAVLSPNALESKWVVREFLYAEKRGIKIIPVQYLPCELPMRMLDLQLIDLQKGHYSRNFDRLLKALDVPTKADALAKDKLKEEEKERIERLEKEKQEKNEEERRKQVEREEIVAREKAQKEAQVFERQIRLEKERQEKVEIQKRRKDEKEKNKAGARLRRLALWQEWKPKLPRLVALAGLGGLVIVGTTMLVKLNSGFMATLQKATSASTSIPEQSLNPISGYKWQRPADGMTMIWVPAGNFKMGQDATEAIEICKTYQEVCDPIWFTDAEPPHTIMLQEFWIDQSEVTNSMYAKCATAGACQQPERVSSLQFPDYYGNSEFSEYPVINVTWEDAMRYCSWAGARLPKEAEWEKAARGEKGNFYPWGNEPPDSFKATFNKYSDVTRIGSHPDGASPYGVLDLAGNVWEWVDAWYAAYPGGNTDSNEFFGQTLRVVRGGSWAENFNLLSSAREYATPEFQDHTIGFRCARSLLESPSTTLSSSPVPKTQDPPTATSAPTATPIPAWIGDFAEPILNAISDQPPFIQDDFSKFDPMWFSLNVFNPGVDCSNSKVSIFNGKLQFTADPGCYGWAELSSYFNMYNFVVQVEMDLKQLDLSDRSTVSIGKYDTFSLWEDGQWETIDCSYELCFSSHRGQLKLNTADPITITYISFDIRNAIYVNGVPLYYFEHAEPDLRNSLKMGIGGGNNLKISSAEFDNFKFWDLDKIKDLSSLLK